MLVDDEELELRELQLGSNPQKCSDHLGTSGVLGCSLCRGWWFFYYIFKNSKNEFLYIINVHEETLGLLV